MAKRPTMLRSETKAFASERLGQAVNVRPHTRLSKGTMPSKRTWHGGTNRPHGLPTMDSGSTLSAASRASGTRRSASAGGHLAATRRDCLGGTGVLERDRRAAMSSSTFTWLAYDDAERNQVAALLRAL